MMIYGIVMMAMMTNSNDGGDDDYYGTVGDNRNAGDE